MKLYFEKGNYKLYQGSMLDMLDVINKDTIDCIVTDPPYELNFMSKGWDNAGVSFNKDTWKKCFDVLKDGGYLLAFGGSRTYHRIACAIEDAGFEIRDCIMWLYGSGFPKSMNIGLAIDKKNGVESEVIGEIKTHDFSKHKGSMMSFANTEKQETSISNVKIKKANNEWQGWGTALKPAFEPIIVARKPFKGSLVDNVIKNGVGGLNIDECRVPFNGDKWNTQKSGKSSRAYQSEETTTAGGICVANDNGRFPANVIHDGSDETIKDMPIANKESVSRYFYCAKASKKDRDDGLSAFESKTVDDGRKKSIDNAFQRGETLRKNTHPTVKPTELMQYLVRLVATKGATILDPFNGSGSTGKAVMYENKERNANYKYIGIELTEEYLPIAAARIEHVTNLKEKVEKFEQLTF